MGDRSYSVYCHENKANGKKYFGITNDIERRWHNNGYYYMHNNQNAFSNAIKKYGWDGFTHNILLAGLTLNEACEAEIMYIKENKTNISRYGNLYGYNLTNGGEGTPGRKCSEEHRKKTSEALLGNTNARNHIPSAAARRKISEKLVGHTVSEKTRNLISDSLKNNASACCRRAVECIDTGAVFQSISSASYSSGVSKAGISLCCSGKRKTAGKMHWKYL